MVHKLGTRQMREERAAGDLQRTGATWKAAAWLSLRKSVKNTPTKKSQSKRARLVQDSEEAGQQGSNINCTGCLKRKEIKKPVKAHRTVRTVQRQTLNIERALSWSFCRVPHTCHLPLQQKCVPHTKRFPLALKFSSLKARLDNGDGTFKERDLKCVCCFFSLSSPDNIQCNPVQIRFNRRMILSEFWARAYRGTWSHCQVVWFVACHEDGFLSLEKTLA